MAGANLYLLNPSNRLNPGTSRPTYSTPVQPIRNGEAANVALTLLQLGPVPGSKIGAAQELALTVQPTSDFQLAVAGDDFVVRFSMRTNVLYDIQHTADLPPSAWSNAATNLSGTNGSIGPGGGRGGRRPALVLPPQIALLRPRRGTVCAGATEQCAPV